MTIDPKKLLTVKWRGGSGVTIGNVARKAIIKTRRRLAWAMWRIEAA